jgi:integrase/recombinase XerD
MNWVHKPLHEVTLGDIQAYADRLEREGLQPASRHRALSAVKSLFAFGHRIGYLQFDVARPLKLGTVRDTLSERILSPNEVQQMIDAERHPRTRVILMVLYYGGVRVSELCGLRWRHCQGRECGGQITVHGKRGKTRSILLPPSVWTEMQSLHSGGTDDAPVFQGRRGRAISPSQVARLVRRAAQRVGIEKPVSPHWLRHCHASHALEQRAPIHLVQATLGHSSVGTTGAYLHARPAESSSTYLPG